MLVSNSGTAERQSGSEKVFPKATVFLVSVGSDKSVNKVMVIISGQPYFMELYDIGSVRVVQKSVYCFLSLSNLDLVRPEGTLFEKSALGRISKIKTRRTSASLRFSISDLMSS